MTEIVRVKADARDRAIETAEAWARDEDEPATAVICAGLPWCDLQGQAAFEAQCQGCPWCERVTVWPSGRKAIVKPGGA